MIDPMAHGRLMACDGVLLFIYMNFTLLFTLVLVVFILSLYISRRSVVVVL